MSETRQQSFQILAVMLYSVLLFGGADDGCSTLFRNDIIYLLADTT